MKLAGHFYFIEMEAKHPQREGGIHTTKQGYNVEIIRYYNSLNSTIKFLTERGTILYNVNYERIKKGTVANPYHPNKFKGFIGEGAYQSSTILGHPHAYKVWSDMIKRVYCDKYHIKKPTYKEISLCEEWHNYQNFAEWFDNNYVDGWKIDKDIICPECKVYSPETCAFVPDDINGMFISSKSYRGSLPIGVVKKKKHFEAYFRGKFLAYSKDDIEYLFSVYKTTREKYTKEIAEKYKEVVDERIYNALIKFEVNITD